MRQKSGQQRATAEQVVTPLKQLRHGGRLPICCVPCGRWHLGDTADNQDARNAFSRIRQPQEVFALVGHF